MCDKSESDNESDSELASPPPVSSRSPGFPEQPDDKSESDSELANLPPVSSRSPGFPEQPDDRSESDSELDSSRPLIWHPLFLPEQPYGKPESESALTRWRQLFFPEQPRKLEAPWSKLWLWLGIAFLLRSIVALGGDFVLHPDEVMQYLEPAHRAVFGNGVVYWEFFYGARSWLVPSLVAGVLWLSDLVGLGEPWFYVYAVKVFFCAISLLIPWGVYHYARLLLPESTARIALVLACLWPMMIIYAHKPLTEFISTAALFGALGLAAQPASYRPAGAFVFGALTALAALLRMQYAPLAALVWLARVLPMRIGKTLYALLAGSFAVVLLVAALETFTWGTPFHSYIVNLLINLEVDKYRPGADWNSYLGRILFFTGMLALPAVWICLRQRRRYLLIGLLVLVTVLLHSLQVHKELRFIFVIFPLLAIAAAGWSHTLSDDAGRQRTAGMLLCVYSAVFAFVMLLNPPGSRWLHAAHSFERYDVYPLINQSNLFDIYKGLAENENVTGVLHLGDPYFNTPGYYYLHRKVPLYDYNSIDYAYYRTRTDDLRKLVSHVVVRRGLGPIDGFTRIVHSGDYTLYTHTSDVKQFRWRRYAPEVVGLPLQILMGEHFDDVKPSPSDFSIEFELR